MVHIREFLPKDEPAVVALWQTVLPSDAPHNEPVSVLRQMLAHDRTFFFVAEVDGSLAGTVMGGYDGHRGWLYSVAVLPELRRRGIATALIRNVEEALAVRGCLKVNLQVLPSNSAAVACYQHLGYDIEDRISMGKRLYD